MKDLFEREDGWIERDRGGFASDNFLGPDRRRGWERRSGIDRRSSIGYGAGQLALPLFGLEQLSLPFFTFPA
jgi:hypothetical protein